MRRKGCVADEHDLLGTQQSVDGVAALCAFTVAACLVALPTVPCACSFVVLCHVVPAVFWQQNRQQVPLKYQATLVRQEEEVLFGDTWGPVPPFHKTLAFVSCYVFIIFLKPKGATLLFVVL